MNTAQDEDDDEEGVKLPGLPANAPNYMTPECYRECSTNGKTSCGQNVRKS